MYISLAGGSNFFGRKGPGEMTVDTVTAGNVECQTDVYTYRCLPYAFHILDPKLTPEQEFFSPSWAR